MAKKHKGLSFYQKEKLITNARIASAASWLFIIGVAVLLAFFVVTTLGIQTTVIGNSMEPTLFNGQVVFLDRVAYSIFSPGRGDVVAFRPNGNLNAHYSVKRVMGVPGDTVEIKGGILYINGESEEELFDDQIADPGVAAEPIVLGDDEFFVMGDNCNSSEDSRSANLGNVRREHIVGRAWLHMAGGDSGIGRVR